MVSDILSEAIDGIDHYLEHPDSLYQGEERDMILKLRNDMNFVRLRLDTPPGTKRETTAQNEA